MTYQTKGYKPKSKGDTKRRITAKTLAPIWLAFMGSTFYFELPVAAQISTSQNLFTGEVTASCSFTDFPTTIPFEWTGSRVQGSSLFWVNANVPVRISWTQLYDIVEPDAPPGFTHLPGATVFKDYGTYFADGSASRNSGDRVGELGNTPNVPQRLRILGYFNFFGISSAPVGQYGFKTTISCLL